MATLVTGATGLVGVNLIRALAGDGEAVRAFVRPGSCRIGLDDLGVDYVEGDVTDVASVREAIRGCDRVYHAAGCVNVSPAVKSMAERVNVGGTRNVCEAALAAGVRRMVHVSSVAAIGAGSMNCPADESTDWNLGYLKSPYYETKAQAERIVHEYIDRGLNAVVVNPGYIVGAWDTKPSSGRMILLSAAGRMRWFPASGGIGFVGADDVVTGMRAAMERGQTGSRYILSAENLTYRAFGRIVAEVAGVRPAGWAVPKGMAYVVGALGSVGLAMGLRFCGDINLPMMRIGFCGHYLDGGKAERELGVRYGSIRTAVAEAIEWFIEHGYLERVEGRWRIPAAERFATAKADVKRPA